MCTKGVAEMRRLIFTHKDNLTQILLGFLILWIERSADII